MSDTLKIEINVTAAKAGLDSLSKSFDTMQTAAATNVGGASASVNKLNTAMSGLKALNPAAVSSVSKLNDSLQSLSDSKLLSVNRAVNEMSGTLKGLTPGQLSSVNTALTQMGTAINTLSASKLTSINSAVTQLGGAVNMLNPAKLMSINTALSSVPVGNITAVGAAIKSLSSGQLTSVNAALTTMSGTLKTLTPGQLSSVNSALNQMNSAINTLSPAKLTSVNAAIGQLGGSINSLSPSKILSINSALAGMNSGGVPKATADAIRNLGTEILNAGGYMAGFGISVGNLVQAVSQVSSSTTSAAAAFASLKGSIGGFGAYAATFVGISVALGVIGTVAANIVGPILEAGQTFDNFRIAVDNLDGGGKGAEALQRLKEVAQSTATSIETSTKSFVGFRAASQSAGFTLQQSLDVFEGFSIGLRGLGADSYRTEKAFLALTQMFSKGKIQAEELRQQLGDAMPGAMQFAAKAIGVTTAELEKLMAAGKLLPQEVLPAMADFLKTNFGDAVAKQVQTATGQITIFKNTIMFTLAAISEGFAGGLGKGFAAGMSEINQALNSEAILAFARAVGELSGAIAAILGGVIGGFIEGLTSIADMAIYIVQAIAGTTTAFADLAKYISENNLVMGTLSNIAGVAGAAIGAFIAILVSLGLAKAAITAGTNLYTAALIRMGLAADKAAASVTRLGVATAGAGAAAGAAGGAMGALGRIFKSGIGMIKAHPIAAVGAAIIAVGGAAVSAYGGVDKVAGSIQKFITGTAPAEQALTGFALSLDNFKNSVRKNADGIRDSAEAYFTFEAAQVRAEASSRALDSQIKSLDATLKGNEGTLGTLKQRQDEAKSASDAYVQSIEREITSIENKDKKFLDMMASMTQREGMSEKEQANEKALTALLGDSTAAINRKKAAIDEEKAAMEFSTKVYEDNVRRNKEWEQSIKDSQEALKQKQEYLKQFKVELSDSALALAEQIVGFGKTAEEAGKLAFAYQEGTRSLQDRSSVIQEAITKDKQYIETLQNSIKQMEATKQAEVDRLTGMGASKAAIAELTSSYDVHIGTMKKVAETTQQGVLAQETLDFARQNGLTFVEAAEQMLAKYSGTLEGNATASDLAKEASALAAKQAEQSAGSTDKAAAASGKLGEATKGSAESIKKASDEAGKASVNLAKVGTTMSTSQTAFDAAKVSVGAIGDSLKTAADSSNTLSITLPLVIVELGNLATATVELPEKLKPLIDVFTDLGAKFELLQYHIPLVNAELVVMAENSEKLQEPLAALAENVSIVAENSSAFQDLATAFGEYIEKLEGSQSTVENATKMAGELGKALEGVKAGYKAGSEGADDFIAKLDSVNSAIEVTIGRLNDLKKAAEDAMKAADKASTSGGGGGGDVQAPAQREGGYAGDRLQTNLVSFDAFRNAPKFASGTANTSQHVSKTPGGGIPSILHPNEAVIPLSRGRSIPVDLSMNQAGSGVDVTALASNVTQLSSAISELSASNRMMEAPTIDLTMEAQAPIVNISAPEVYSGPSVSPVPPRGNEVSDTGLYGPRSGPSAPDADRTDVPTTETKEVYNITMNITTPDANSFKKTEDQTLRDLQRKINRARRRVS